jgi:hypothetical protein
MEKPHLAKIELHGYGYAKYLAIPAAQPNCWQAEP